MITENLVNEFNDILEKLNCSFRLKYGAEIITSGEFRIIPFNNLFIDYAYIELSKEFITKLENFFEDRHITLSHNDDRTLFWAKKN